MSHATDKIPVGRGQGPFAGCQDSHVPAQAGAAGRGADGRMGIEENIEKSFFHGRPVDLLGCRDDDQPEAGIGLTSFQHGGRHPQIFNPAVGAGADDDLIERDVAHFADAPRVGRQMGKGDLGLYFTDIDLQDPGIDRIGIGGVKV